MSTSNPIVDALRPTITDVVKEVVPAEVAKAVKGLKCTAAISLTAKPDIAAEVASIVWQPHPFAGKWVVVRSGESGVHFGYMVGRQGGEYYLVNSRRLWSWEAKKGVALSGVAKYGINVKNSKIDAEVDIYVHGVIECIPCSDEAVQIIREAA